MERDISKNVTLSLYPWLWAGALCAAGAAVSLYLAYLHVAGHTDFNYTRFCAYSRAVNCETVAESPFSVFLQVPVAVWGIWGYLLMAVVVWLGLSSEGSGRRMWMVMYTVAGISSLISIVLFVISKLYIRSLCIFCLASYAINFALLALAMHYRSKRKVGFWSGLKQDLAFMWGKKTAIFILSSLLVVAVILPMVYPPYWKTGIVVDSSQFHKGFTQEGDPWIGAPNPSLTIVEYSDYRCFYCRKAHLFLRSLLQRFPDKLRIVHKNFPLDGECNPAVEGKYHQGACNLAAWSICAGKQGSFWRMHDALFQLDQNRKRIELKDLARELNLDYGAFLDCFDHASLNKKLADEIKQGISLGIDATPCYVIDGKLYKGKIPKEVLEKRLGQLD